MGAFGCDSRAREILRKEIENRQHKTRKLPVYRLAAACACLLFFIGIGGYNVYSSPVSYISIDVNPSIELELNRWDKLVGVTSYNEDGAKIVDNIKVKNMQYTEAIQSLLSDEEYQSYLKEITI